MTVDPRVKQAAVKEPGPRPHAGISGNRDFMKLWAGETVSLVGTQITQFALPLVAILTLQASVFQVGVLNACRNIPVVLVSLFVGVWLDRRRRRPVLIACCLVNAFLIGMIPVASVLGLLSMNLLYLICILSGAVSVTFDVGVLSYVPSLVGRRHLADSNSRMQSSFSLAMVAGPGIAGVVVGILTAPITLALDAVSYVCSALGLISIRTAEPAPEVPDIRLSIWRSIGEGWQILFGNRVFRDLLTQSAWFNFVQSGFITIFVVYAIRDLRLTPLQLGIVLGAIAVGALCGSMIANRVRNALGLGRTMLIAILLGTLCQLGTLIPRDSGPASICLLCVIEFCYGCGVMVFRVNTITLLQTMTPNRLLGRMNASYRLTIFGTAPVGAVLVGVLGRAVGLHVTLVITVLVFVTPVLWTLFSPIFRMQEMPSGPAEESEPAPMAALETSTMLDGDQTAQPN
ncbi:MAG: MFS transporter [Jatrophihabitantaceae bacterium]